MSRERAGEMEHVRSSERSEMQKRPHRRVRASKLRLLLESYERAAAAAFFAAFTAVAALRRRLVLGGVAGASPINSAVMILVTKSFGP